ncbi:MAG TPA: response regulator transcription factor [Noviherbaspirillum sp.]|uniref:response regulator transcription factor n=1 Tax=Noviherbaspirillum sp. TaxID=1926288 RepID=UPI002D43C005|nr:response regulator transcription factor [Noviherbaspirillum sp.]HYD97602.1 response regulator transcription factor [Noviherbaspirillum sp.]
MNGTRTTIRVMVIDDHQTMLWGLEKLIEGEEPRMKLVATATSCGEALAKAQDAAPDVILLDLDIGGESGLDILPALLSGRATQVLILTGARDQMTLDSAVLLGARGVLRKDAPAQQVLKAIEKVHQGELWLDHNTVVRMFGQLINPTETNRTAPQNSPHGTLTAKERTIVRAIVEENGASNKVIAKKLCISEHTLRNHLTSIYQKLGVGNRLELYVYAVQNRFDNSPRTPVKDAYRSRTVDPAAALVAALRRSPVQ